MEIKPLKKNYKIRKINGLDKTNRSVSLLRYRLVLHSKEQFIADESKRIIHQSIYNYFYPENQKRKNIKLISVYIQKNKAEINFQCFPSLDLKIFIENLFGSSQEYIMNHLNIVNRSYWLVQVFLYSQRQAVKQQIDKYLRITEA